jgi:hypothetical protein
LCDTLRIPIKVEAIFMRGFGEEQGLLSRPDLGLYTLRLYKHGAFVPIIIDDFLPMQNEATAESGGAEGELPPNKSAATTTDRRVMTCRPAGQFPKFAWASLCEKAYAKLMGSWEALKNGGCVEEVLEDFTGGVGGRFFPQNNVAPDRLFAYLKILLDERKAVFAVTLDPHALARSLSFRRVEAHWPCAIVKLKSLGAEPDGNLVRRRRHSSSLSK